jgi:hypothetical protein
VFRQDAASARYIATSRIVKPPGIALDKRAAARSVSLRDIWESRLTGVFFAKITLELGQRE